jgi:hypothetical protein
VQLFLLDYSSNLHAKANFLQHNSDFNSRISGETVSDVLRDEKYPLSELIQSTPVLIYKIIDSSCIPCNEAIFEKLLELHDMFKGYSQSVVILSTYHTKRRMRNFSADNNIVFSTYYIHNESLNEILEEIGESFFFVLNPGLRISDIYIADKQFPELNRQYLESIKRFLQ